MRRGQEEVVLGIAQALLNDPAVLFLDEPTDGVDPIGRREIRDLLAGLRDDGKTIFLNSHLPFLHPESMLIVPDKSKEQQGKRGNGRTKASFHNQLSW